LLGQIIDILDPNPSGVDHLKVSPLMLDEGGKAIPGNASKILDDRQTATS
jgi:hypothetical protein